MSQPSLANQPGGAGVPVQKQKTNVYTVMLIISFVCILTAIVLLVLELRRWGTSPYWDTSSGTPTPQAHYSAPGPAGPAPTLFC